ncbi:hypothetical protein GX411_10065 [Candidatus Fermentibacteria bacterium]|nr:hypothetical protein [Candidatus Fermentibacteria bacterium]
MLRNSALILLLASAAGASTGTADALLLVSQGFASQMRLGSASWAVGEGAWAVTANPSLTAPGFHGAGGRWNLEATTVSVAGGFGAGGGFLAGGALRFLGMGGLIARDETGQATGEYTWSSGALTAGGSFALSPSVRLGASLGPVWESAGSDGASGFSASAGACFRPSEGVLLGAALHNAGFAPSWDGIHKDMPTEVSAGVSVTLPAGLRAVAGGVYGFSTSARASLAGEFSRSGLSISAGYELTPDSPEMNGAFGGVEYRFVEQGTYGASLAFRQSRDLSWPMLAGLSIEF